MKQLKVPAVFMRGGTSNAVVFKQQDLPADRALWPEIFLAAQGSPDPFGRQLNAMGGGISSLSAAARILIDKGIGCLPVTEDGKLVGVLTEGDYVRLAAGNLDKASSK